MIPVNCCILKTDWTQFKTNLLSNSSKTHMFVTYLGWFPYCSVFHCVNFFAPILLRSNGLRDIILMTISTVFQQTPTTGIISNDILENPIITRRESHLWHMLLVNMKFPIFFHYTALFLLMQTFAKFFTSGQCPEFNVKFHRRTDSRICMLTHSSDRFYVKTFEPELWFICIEPVILNVYFHKFLLLSAI